MENHGESTRVRRLRAARDAALVQVYAIESLAAEWEPAAARMETPEGFSTYWDAGTATTVIRRVLAQS
jgi:hypothetical protein